MSHTSIARADGESIFKPDKTKLKQMSQRSKSPEYSRTSHNLGWESPEYSASKLPLEAVSEAVIKRAFA
jgi:hypothetical protein